MSKPMIHNADELEALALERGLLPFFACGIPDCSIEDFTPSRYWFAEGVDGPWEWRMEVARRGMAAHCQRHFKMSFFAEMECRFLQGSIQVLYSLIHHITCRFEARQALIYQLVSGLTGKNGKYNYSKAVHLYPPFFDIFCSPKNYKTASALTPTASCSTKRPGW